MCTGECCGTNCTMWAYGADTNGTYKQEPWATSTCVSHGYHCDKEIGQSSGTCKTGQHGDKAIAGAVSICLLLLILICLCGICGYCHHRKVKEEKKAVEEAMIANEEA